MKKLLLFEFTQLLFRKMSFRITAVTVLTFLSVQSSFSQVWTTKGSTTDFGTSTNATNPCNKIALVFEGGSYVPYVANIENLATIVRRRKTDGTWEQVGANLVTAAANATTNATTTFPDLSVDGNNNLYASYIDVNNSNRLAVVKYNSGSNTWDPLVTGNPYVSTLTALGANSTSFKATARGAIAFNSSNVPYVVYNEAGSCIVKKFNGTAWEQVGATFSSPAGGTTVIASQKLIIDENDQPWVATVNIADNVTTAATAGTLSLFKYDGVSTFSAVTAVNANSHRDFDITFVKGTGTTNSGKIAIIVYQTNGTVRAYAHVYDKNALSWTSATLSSGTPSYTAITSDPNGNLYAIFRDTGNIPRVKMLQNNKTNTPSANWVELLNSGAALESTTTGWNAIGIGNAPYPYIAYSFLPTSPTAYTTTARVYDPTTTWNGSVWSAGTPTTTLEAIIDGDYSTTTNGAISAKKITVNATKTLTINSTTNVTVQDQVINNGTLTVENNANLIQVNTYANTGSISVKRNSNPLSRLDYTLWSSPVASQNLAAFSPLTSQSPSRFYTYDGPNNVYAAVASPTTTSFAAGTGYLIRMPNTAAAYPTTQTFAGTFTGVPNNGTVILTGLTSDKFYAVGNPYPSVVSADLFLGGNSTAGTLYFWRKTNGIANTGSAYATYTLAGGVGTAAPGNAVNDILPNGKIQVGQGFIVKTGVAATTLSFTNTMRESAPTSTQFLKIKNTDEKSRIWLNLTSGETFSQALVAYMDGATEGVDNGIDGKYINDSQVALTSNIDGEEYIIQGRPAFDASDVVPLNFKTDKAGEYKIAIDRVDGLFAKGQNVYLVDSVTGVETNLTKEAYTFTAESGTANSRFALKYQSLSKNVGSPVFNENTVTVYRNNGTLYVNSAGSAIVNIKVFNLQGRLIAEQKEVNANTAAIKNLKATQQVVIVQVTSEDKKVVTKKVVN